MSNYQHEVKQQNLKIVMVAACPFPANHGTPGAIRELSVFLARAGVEVHVVTYPEGECESVEGIHIHRAGAFDVEGKVAIGPGLGRIASDARMVPTLIKVIREYDIDVIHTHNYEGAIVGSLAKMVTRVPMVYTGINSMFDELPTYTSLGPGWFSGFIGKWLDRTVPRGGDVMMLLSDELRDYLVQEGLPQQRMVVVPPGVDLSLFEDAAPQALRERIGLTEDDPIVLYTGALERFQRTDLLLHAFVRVLDKVKTAKLLIAGNIPNPDAAEHLLKLAEELGIRHALIYQPAVPLAELKHYIAAANVATVPRPETPGFPIKLLNYMAMGKPIVSFRGSAKSIFHGYNGLIAEDEDVESFADGIITLLTHPELGDVLGNRARQTAIEHFSWDTLIPGIIKLYGELIDNGRGFDRAKLSPHLSETYTPKFVSNVSEPGESFPLSGTLTFQTYLRKL